MTGEIIYFQSHRGFKRGQLYRDQTVPRRAPAGGRSKDPSRSSDPADFVPEARNTQNLELQVARIGHLLDELEELACTSNALPAATLTQPRADVESERRALPKLSAQIADDGEGDPQPEIDGEKLDHIYRDLYSDA
jgi:hypothetical protein